MNRHSPAPWSSYWDAVMDCDGRYILDRSPNLAGAADGDETMANAALAASAPEMLKLLRRIWQESLRDSTTDRVWIHEELRRAAVDIVRKLDDI